MNLSYYMFFQSKSKSSSKRPCSSINFLCSLINVFKCSNVFSLALVHLRWMSLSHFLTTRMTQSKLSIPIQDCQRFMMTPTILKTLSVSICEPTMPNTWQNTNDTCGNCTTCATHHTKGFLVFVGRTHNHWKTCNSFFNVDMMASSKEKINPKK